MNNHVFKYLRGDKTIWLIIFLLSVISLLAIYSSTGTLAYAKRGGNTEYFVIKHFLVLGFGLFFMYAAHQVKYTYYSRLSQLLIILTIPLLLFTLYLGTTINGEPRWITLPIIGLTFQTSDLAKLALVMYVARMLSKYQAVIKEKKTFYIVMLPVVATCALIFPANFSTATLLFLVCFLMLFIGGIRLKYLSQTVGIGLVAIICMLTLMFTLPAEKMPIKRMETWKNRIANFSDQDKTKEDGVTISDANYQSMQAKIAIASGGFFGKGPGESTQRNYLPHPYSDFVYAFIIEEYGIPGALLVIMLYLWLLYRGIRVAQKCEGSFGSFLVMGIILILTFQAFINMAVAVGLFPVTGQTLPFISMGGSSIWFTSLGVGIILSVSAEVEKQGENANIDEQFEEHEGTENEDIPQIDNGQLTMDN